jgi:O-antigen ligase
MPFIFILGPTFFEIFCFFLVIAFLFKAKSSFYKTNKKYIYLFLVFFLFLLLRSLVFSLEFEKIRSVVFYFRFLFYVLALIYFINQINNKHKYFIKIIFFGFLLLILDSIIQYYYGKNIFNTPLYDQYRASSFFGKELILGSFLFRFLPFIFIILILFKFDFKKYKLNLSFFLGSYFFSVLISGERTSFFLLLLTIFLLIILIKDFRKILLCSLIFFLFINLIFSFSKKNPYDRMFKYTFSQMISQKVDSKVDTKVDSKVDLKLDSKLKENFSNLELNKKINSFSNNYVFSKEHQGHYIITLRMFLDNPIFGQGPRSFRYLCSEDRFIKSDGICTTHPHNTYLQLLAETGLIGFLFVFALFLFTLKQLVKKFFKNFKHKNRDNNFVQIKYISLIAIFVSLFPLAPSGNFFNNWLSFVYYYPIAFYIYSINKSKY